MTGVIARFGALGVFLLMVPESACIPVPSEVTLLFSGFAVDQGWMSFPLAVLAATAGNLVGSLIAYGVGATGSCGASRPRLGAAPVGRPVRATRYSRCVYRPPVALARTFVSLPAGARRRR